MFCGSCEICSAAARPMSRLTIAKTPTLTTRDCTRRVTAQSHAELEAMEIKEMKKYVHSIYILGFLLAMMDFAVGCGIRQPGCE